MRMSLMFFAAWFFCVTKLSADDATSGMRPILKVAAINVPPLAYMHPDTMIVSGSVAERVQKRVESCGAVAAFIFSPSWARAYQMAITGTADGLIPTTYSESRLSDFDYAEPAFVDLRPSLIVRTDSPFYEYTGLDMLKGLRIGRRAKALMGKAFDEYVASGQVTLVERMTSKGLAEVLFEGQVDFIVDSPSVMTYHLGQDQVDAKVRILEPSLGQSLQYLALSKKRSAQFAENTKISACLLKAEQ